MSGGGGSSSLLRQLEFFLISLVFHLIFTWSIFDVYFHSPVVYPSPRFNASHAVPQAPWTDGAPAERLVLIVADGLRADTLFKQHPTSTLPTWAQPNVRGTESVYEGSYDNAFSRHTPSVSNEDEQPSHAYVGPFLRGIAQGPGRYGVSHTHVPTESRPGHVALIAGMYEDISAVTKGWKVNPLAFDSLLNQSTYAFSYGSPDIVPMFALGTTEDKMEWAVYDEEAEDFTKDAVELDMWVLAQMQELMERGKTNKTLDDRLRAPGTVFFLHLLGLDTTGHTYRPHSPEYLGNTIVVDAIAREVDALFEDYFDDDKTAFLFTADHGMSRKGNHGDGDPDNTRTPLVAWGAGIPPAQRLSRRGFAYTEYDKHWDLEYYARTDVEQADLTPLMASWIGIPVPANAEGHLPMSLLDAPPAYRARAALATARQVLEVYRVKHNDRAARMAHFQPFPALRSEPGVQPGEARIQDIARAIEQGDFENAVEECESLMHDALAGAKYLHQYDAPILSTVVVLGYVGLFLYGVSCLLVYALPTESRTPTRRVHYTALTIVMLSFAVVWSKFYLDSAPMMYFVYSGATGLIWMLLSTRIHLFPAFLPPHVPWPQVGWAGLYVAICVVFLEAAMYGYLHRLLWLAIVLTMAMIPVMLFPMTWKEGHQVAVVVWVIVCAATAWFMSLPTDKEESVPLLSLGGGLLLIIGLCVYIWPAAFLMPPDYLGRRKKMYAMMHAKTTDELTALSALPDDKEEGADTFWPRTRWALLVQLVCLATSIGVTATAASSLAAKQGLPRTSQVLGWAVLLCSASAPFVLGFQRPQNGRSQPLRERILLLVFAFAPVYVILSLRDEVLFFLCYTLLVLLWGHMEAELARDRAVMARGPQANMLHPLTPAPRPMQLDDVRLGLFYFLLLNIGFFGTGNVASISSFYLSPVYRLVPVFQPFLMALLLVVKLIVPFILLSSVLMALCLQAVEPRALPAASSRLAIVASGLGLRDVYMPLVVAALAGNVLALNFFFAIRDEGSWLEIGQSITHFVMANLMQLYMLAIASFSGWLLGRPTTPSTEKSKTS
ncbi:Glycosyl phosphatidyl inositol anchor synthesis [Malassezia pachydermatis]|uniref:GPI ethanolamine phosphate transferase 1 n=1 Tax=Malassezia pachydermatis TaxID=77020 RepID=A0A0M9VP50_9BASI|nr:mcd4-sporulation protein [Malassezia pachydermatis]KOS14065.1 mcd4-sporulation protein [Malassezia pachydermatis]